jgi:hypothetical protein
VRLPATRIFRVAQTLRVSDASYLGAGFLSVPLDSFVLRLSDRKEPGILRGLTTVSFFADDVRAAFDRFESAGATVLERPIERGPGFVTASVVDPFGNILGVMYNKHYLEILESRRRA